MFPSSDRNMNGSLREREMLWEDEPRGECFQSFFVFSQTFMSLISFKPISMSICFGLFSKLA